jgi:uncharacterized OsmC-like protein
LSEEVLTKLELIEGYRFKVEFDENIPSIIVDETKPLGEGTGPNPTRLLSAAVGHCLSSSLIFCLNKARIKPEKLSTQVKATIERNQEGYLRVTSLNAEIQLEVNPKDKTKLPRCLSLFGNYCTVTQSVKKGIPININIK